MIDAKELRIGNKVLFKGLIMTLSSGSVIDKVADYSEPIPLTPEILEKCGFDDYDKYNVILELNIGHYSVLIIRKHDGLCILQQTDTDSYHKAVTDTISLNDIKYLHQLQNLYFALTGEELEIKELV